MERSAVAEARRNDGPNVLFNAHRVDARSRRTEKKISR